MTRRFRTILVLCSTLALSACSSVAETGKDGNRGPDGTGGLDGGGEASGGEGAGEEGGAGDGEDEGGARLDVGGGGTGGTTGGGDGGSESGGTTGGGDEGGSSTGAADSSTGTTGDNDTEGDTDGMREVCQDQRPVTMYLSPDDSNSMSSPIQFRNAINAGDSLYGVPLRPWEFFNFYSFDYPAAPPGQVGVHASLVEADENHYTLQIGIASEAVADNARAPMNLTLVLDESGSMSGTPMAMQKETARAIAASLRSGDLVSLVTWDTNNAVVLDGHEITGADDATLLAAIDDLSAGGGTDLNGGLRAGYQLAAKHRTSDRINRIVLVSDGGANTGVTDEQLIGMHAGANDEDGIYLVGVGVGRVGSYKDTLMDTVTDLGKGASVFIGNTDDAWDLFHERFLSTVGVAARDVRVRLDLPPGFEFVRFSGEEASTDPTEIEPQHLAPNDAMVFHQVLETCAPELITSQTELTVTASYLDAVTFESKQSARTYTFDELLAIDPAQLRKGAAVLAYVDALEAIKTRTNEADAVAAGRAAIAGARELLPQDRDLAEMEQLLDRASGGMG